MFTQDGGFESEFVGDGELDVTGRFEVSGTQISLTDEGGPKACAGSVEGVCSRPSGLSIIVAVPSPKTRVTGGTARARETPRCRVLDPPPV